ncbi:MAG: hypothetical protein GY803_09395 [Chloroflexi bacterium]|nr:hypothetical protein [Chloroflexota bacterium]
MIKKVLVSYATGSGSTREVAEAIGDVLSQTGVPVAVHNVKTVTSMSGYSAIVLGSSIRLGRWLPEAVEFLQTFKNELQNKPVAYFTTCLTMVNDTEKNRRAVLTYLEPIIQRAPEIDPVGLGLFAGSLTLEQHTIPSHIGFGPMGDYRDWDAIKAWAEKIRPAILAGKARGGERPLDLAQVTLSHSDLSGANLSQSNLWQADLRKTQLRAANLHAANLQETNLTKADLRNADLHEAGLGWAELSQSRLQNANLQQANLLGANLEQADLTQADLRQATLNGANLQQANLRQAQLNQADLNWANLSESNLREADLRQANLCWADFSDADLSQAILENARYNEQTKWPDDFDAAAADCIFVSQQT